MAVIDRAVWVWIRNWRSQVAKIHRIVDAGSLTAHSIDEVDNVSKLDLKSVHLVIVHRTAIVAVLEHSLKHVLHLPLDLVKASLLKHLVLGLQSLVLLVQHIELVGLHGLPGQKSLHKLVKLVLLVLRQVVDIVVFQSRVVGHQVRLLDLVLKLSTLPFQSIVVLLKDSDELLVVINLFAVKESDIFAGNSKISRSSGQVSEKLVLTHELLNLVLDVVDVSVQLVNLLILFSNLALKSFDQAVAFLFVLSAVKNISAL